MKQPTKQELSEEIARAADAIRELERDLMDERSRRVEAEKLCARRSDALERKTRTIDTVRSMVEVLMRPHQTRTEDGCLQPPHNPFGKQLERIVEEMYEPEASYTERRYG